MEREKLTVLDPVGEMPELGAREQLANRAAEIDGKVIGFLVNEQGDHLITDFAGYCEAIQSRLSASYNVPEFVWQIKPILSRPAPEEQIEALVGAADLVVNGIGK
ncbi:MAG: hypothetical protein HY329_02835 [Chloroflexi bacterium]|nr:hypothetical protein [Chloroflexota bacterium]